MSEIAELIGSSLHWFGDWLAPRRWTLRRALVLLFAALCLSVALFSVAYHGVLPW